MKITVKVKPGSRVEILEKTGERVYLARLKARPEKGKANEALVRLLSEQFGIPRQAVRIVSGHTSKMKLVELI